MNSWTTLGVFACASGVLYVISTFRINSVHTVAPSALGLTVFAASVVVLGAMRGSPLPLSTTFALACAVVCAASDLATGFIFDTVTASAALTIAVACAFEQRPVSAVMGAAICFVSLFALYGITRGRGIGLGDVKLGGIIGAGIGGVESLGAIGAAFVVGAVYCAPLLVMGRLERGDRIPFAPFMAFGMIAFVATHVVSGHG